MDLFDNNNWNFFWKTVFPFIFHPLHLFIFALKKQIKTKYDSTSDPFECSRQQRG